MDDTCRGPLESRIRMGWMTWLTGTSIDTGSVADPVPRSKRIENAVHLLGLRFQEEFRAKSSERHIQPQAREIKVLHVMSQGDVVDTTASLMFSMCIKQRAEKNINSPATEPLGDLLFRQELFILRPAPYRQRLGFGINIRFLSRTSVAPTQQHQISGGTGVRRRDRRHRV